MKKIILVLLAIFLSGVFLHPSFADRNTPTITAYTSDTLIKQGDAKIYWIDYVVTTNGGGFTIYDALTPAGSGIKTEGSQAVANNGGHIDFTNKPLELSTGLYLDVNNCNVVIAYE